MIGAPELIAAVLVLAMLAIPVGVVFVIVRVITKSGRNTPGLVPCSACRRPLLARAPACPYCGTPQSTA